MINNTTQKLQPVLTALVLTAFAFFSEARIPELRVTEEGSEASLPLVGLTVRITLRGHLAKTEFDLTYMNELNRDVQAEFLFPIPASATLTDIGLYFNDKLRHAVAVEREKGRIAFDEIVHKRVDPALAEWLAGNTFRLDIYPVPANNTKTVYVAYEEDLTTVKNKLRYSLDLKYQKLLKDFSLSIDADDSFELENDNLQQLRKESGKWNFKGQNRYVDATISLKAARVITVALSEPSEKSGEHFVSVRIRNDLAETKLRPASSVVLFWDVSASASLNNSNVVYEFLKKFLLSQQHAVQLFLIPFHMEVENPNFINNAASPSGLLSLKRKIKSLINTGGTDLVKLFEEMPEHLQKYPSDSRVLLVTDGLDSMHSSAQVLAALKKLSNHDQTILVISGSDQQDTRLLSAIARRRNGWFASLDKETNVSDVVTRTNKLPYNINLDSKSPELYDAILTSTPDGNLILTGRTYGPAVSSELALRYSNIYSSHIKQVSFQPRVLDGTSGIVRAAWARAKLDDLLGNAAEDAEILAHGLKYKLMTPQTSLIVLESWQDYHAYGIEMPEDVQREYEDEIEEMKEQEAQVMPLNVQKPVECIHTTSTQINGVVTDDRGFPLPGVSILAESSGLITQAATTDACGEFHFSNLPPARYTITASIEGFTEITQAGLDVTRADKLRLQYSLRPSLAEEFTVAGESPAFNLTSSGSSELFRDFSNDPIEFFQMASLSRDEMRSLMDSTLEQIANISDSQEAKIFYVKSRAKFKTVPEFFVRAYQVFQNRDHEFSDRVLLDLTEFNTFSAATYRMLARTITQNGRLDLALQLLLKALSISKSESQTWREIGLMYAKAGMLDKAKESYKQALNQKNLDRFEAMISLIEEEKTKLDYATSAIDLEVDNEIDLKVVLNWNSNYTDVDLHVVEPSGERVYFSHMNSNSGGQLLGDITQGYGPEIYRIKNASTGTYQIYVEYYSSDDTSLSISNMAFVTVYLRDRSGKLIRTDYPITLTKDNERLLVTSVQF